MFTLVKDRLVSALLSVDLIDSVRAVRYGTQGLTTEDKHILTLAVCIIQAVIPDCLTVFAYFLIKHKADSDERTDLRGSEQSRPSRICIDLDFNGPRNVK